MTSGINLDEVVLARGSHSAESAEACAMELVAMMNGEAKTDAPSCTAAPLRRFVIATNDWCNDEERQQLKPFLTRLISTSSEGRDADRKAAFMFADWAVREVAPLAMDARKQPKLAARLRAIPQIMDKASAVAARDETRSVRADAADAAAYAADAAAYAAYAADAAAYAADAAAYAADAAAYAYAARKDSLERRLTVLDRILREAYGH